MEDEYISLFFNDDLLDDERELLSYPISYHSRIILDYNNPNIVFKVKYNDSVTTYTMDYNKSVLEIVKKFVEVLHCGLNEL